MLDVDADCALAAVELISEFTVEAAELLAAVLADNVTALLLDVAARFCRLTAGPAVLAAAA